MKSILIFEKYNSIILPSRIAILFINLLIFLVLKYDVSVFWVVNVLILTNILYYLFLFKKVLALNEKLALALNTFVYIVVATMVIYFTGGMHGPLFMLLFFSPIGTSMSYGKISAHITVLLEITTLFLLSIFYPVYSIFNEPNLIFYIILLIMTGIFGSVVAGRYIDIRKARLEQEKLSKKLAKNLKETQEIRQRERDMFDILGHELRTPLGIARNSVYLLNKANEEKDINPELLNKYLPIANEHLDREIRLVESILTGTKIENDRLNLILEKVDVTDVINDSLIAYRKRAKIKNLSINFNENKEAYVFADRTRIQEIVDNLIDNAIKYTEVGTVDIKIVQLVNAIRLEISDSGIGISKEDIAKLGNKFYRVNNYLDHNKDDMKLIRPGGTGLGMFVVFNLVKAMNGHIDITSTPGKGSTFAVTFPIYKGQATQNTNPHVYVDKIAEFKEKHSN